MYGERAVSATPATPTAGPVERSASARKGHWQLPVAPVHRRSHACYPEGSVRTRTRQFRRTARPPCSPWTALAAECGLRSAPASAGSSEWACGRRSPSRPPPSVDRTQTRCSLRLTVSHWQRHIAPYATTPWLAPIWSLRPKATSVVLVSHRTRRLAASPRPNERREWLGTYAYTHSTLHQTVSSLPRADHQGSVASDT
jgi:hypothetical protein